MTKKPKPKSPEVSPSLVLIAIIVLLPYVLLIAQSAKLEDPWCAPIVVTERSIAKPVPAAPVEAIPLPRARPKEANARPVKKRTKFHPRPPLSPWGLPPPRYMFP